jgi:hypothetical protein
MDKNDGKVSALLSDGCVKGAANEHQDLETGRDGKSIGPKLLLPVLSG